MAERFERLYKSPDNLYISGSPVIISAGSLLKDSQTGSIIVQLKFHSVSENAIKAVKVSLSAFDVSGMELQGVKDYQYLDLSIQNGQEFGSNKAIVLPSAVTRSFAISNITVVFSNGNQWKYDNTVELTSLPVLKYLSHELRNIEIEKQYKFATTSSATYIPFEIMSIWNCTCGEWNSSVRCTKCGLAKQVVFSAFNIEELKINAENRIAAEKAQQEELERIEKEKRKEAERILAIQKEHRETVVRKSKIISAIIVPIVALVLTFALWIYPYAIKPMIKYNEAIELLENKQFDAATDAFENLKNYKDSADMAKEAQYQKAGVLLSEQKYEEAVTIFENIVGYKDSDSKSIEISNIICSSIYAQAESNLQLGNVAEAAIMFGQLGNYKEANNRSQKLWSEIVHHCTLSMGHDHSIAIKENGEVVATGSNEAGQCDVDMWKNIISVSAGWEHTLGLCWDGTVVSTSYYPVEDWKNIVAVSAGGFHVVGLQADGTVVAVGDNSEGQCDVEKWENIIAISAGQRHTVGLKSDGTVVATGYNENGQCRVETWKDVVAISANMYRTVGVKSDGTVVEAGENDHGQGNVDDWTDIVSVASTRDVTFGLKSDGTVVSCGYNYKGVCEVEEWRDIVAIATNGDSVIGITSGGYAVDKGVFGLIPTYSGLRITEHMLDSVDTLSSKISGIDFGPEGYIEYYLKVESDEDNKGTNILEIYKNGAISLRRVTVRGEGLGPSTSLFLNEEDDIAEWNPDTQTFTVDINNDISCTITILDGGVSLKIVRGECDWGIEGNYTIKANE